MPPHGPLSSPPPPPPGHHRIAWYGISLLLPDSWNLALHHGTARAGRLTFTNLHRPTLHVRWRTTPARRFQQLLTRLASKPNATLQQLSPTAAKIHLNAETLLLAHDTRRLCELHWPTSQDATATTIDNFLTTLRQPDDHSDWLWSIYGAEGYAPARATLKRASLLPGATELNFICPGGTALTLGSFSMADRLLAGRSLQNWAKREVAGKRHLKAGDWEETSSNGGQQAVFHAKSRQWRFGLRRKASHTFIFEHDRLTDRIRWTHRLERQILTPAAARK